MEPDAPIIKPNLYTYEVDVSLDSEGRLPKPWRLWDRGVLVTSRPSLLETTATGRLLVWLVLQSPRMESALRLISRSLADLVFAVRLRRISERQQTGPET